MCTQPSKVIEFEINFLDHVGFVAHKSSFHKRISSGIIEVHRWTIKEILSIYHKLNGHIRLIVHCASTQIDFN
jgi:hypothetical protein